MKLFKQDKDEKAVEKKKKKRARRLKKHLIRLAVFLGLIGAVSLAYKNRRRIAVMILSKKLPEEKKNNIFVKLLLKRLKKRS